MIRTPFFLSSHDYVSSPEPRQCRVVSEHIIEPSGDRAYWASVKPSIPVDTERGTVNAHAVLLAMIGPKWSIDRLGDPGFMVELYYLKDKPIADVDAKELIKIGVGSLHTDASEACRHAPLEKEELHRTEELLIREINFIGPQNGEPEEILKQNLVQRFRNDKNVLRAYLMRVNYGRPEEESVALCVVLRGAETRGFRKDLGNIFARQFNKAEFLDVIVLSKGEEADIRNVFAPFYSSSI